MRKCLYLLVIMMAFAACSDGSKSDVDDFESVDTHESDESVDETIDETVDLEQDDEQVDEVVDEISDETIDEMPDEDNVEEAPEGMVSIPAGSFWMGSPESELGRDFDETLHYVELTKGFYMDSTEVTQKNFTDLMGYNPSNFSNCGDNCPVEQVSWHEAIAYANERSKAESLEECFDCTGTAPDFECTIKTNFTKPQDCKGYRLPTESEWEYAARAGSDTAFYNGDITETDCEMDANLDAIGWYCGNSGNTTNPVGGKLSNSFGLFNMSGNVWEWNWDWYGSTYPTGTEASPDVDPTGPENGSLRVTRGGSWLDYAQYCRSADRDGSPPSIRVSNLGFRLTRTK